MLRIEKLLLGVVFCSSLAAHGQRMNGEGAKETRNEAILVSVTPNPAAGRCMVTIGAPADEPARITLFNIIGQKIAEYPALSNRPLEMGLGYPAGIYIVCCSTAHGSSSAKLIIH
jgi:hypothetical protein